MLAHRYVWTTVHGEIPTGFHVCHRCDNPPCINPEHLFIGTDLDNVRDMIAKNRHSHGAAHGAKNNPPKGSANPQAKLTEEQVRIIRAERAAGVPLQTLADRYGVVISLISRAASRKIWRHVA